MFESFFASMAISAGLLTAAVFSPFAGVSDSINTQVRSASDRAAITRVASTSPQTIACVSAAVNTRESALMTAHSALSSSLNSAYSARAAALKSAYAQTSTQSIRSAVEAAWKAFSTSTRNAQKTWKTAQEAAWKTFNAAARACKAPASVTDSLKSTSEVSGQ